MEQENYEVLERIVIRRDREIAGQAAEAMPSQYEENQEVLQELADRSPKLFEPGIFFVTNRHYLENVAAGMPHRDALIEAGRTIAEKFSLGWKEDPEYDASAIIDEMRSMRLGVHERHSQGQEEEQL